MDKWNLQDKMVVFYLYLHYRNTTEKDGLVFVSEILPDRFLRRKIVGHDLKHFKEDKRLG
jgi:hypothetical protein